VLENTPSFYWISAGYGLTLFSLGLAIIVHVIAFPTGNKQSPFLGLAGFALLHGFLIWAELMNSMMGQDTPNIIEVILVGFSFASLGWFGMTILGMSKRYLLFSFGLMAVVWGGFGLLGGEERSLQHYARWFLVVPIVMIAVIAFIRTPLIEKWDVSNSRISFLAAAGFFVFAITLIFAPAGEITGENAIGIGGDAGLTWGLDQAVRAVSILVVSFCVMSLFHAYESVHIRNHEKAEEVEARLDLSRAMLQSVFDLAPVGLAINRKSDGQFLQGNAALFEPTGYTAEEFSELSYWDLTPKEYEAQEQEMLTMLTETGRYGPYEKHYINKNGQYYPVLLSGVRMINEVGEELIVSAVQDITLQKQHENDLDRQRLLAEAANVSKSQFLANMSHEIRTPMNGVLGLISVLATTKLDEKQKRVVKIIQDSGEALLSILNDILDFSQIESGKTKIEMIAFSLDDLISRFSSVYGLKAQEKGLELAIKKQDGLEDVRIGDPTRITQVVSNLISNSLKFTEKGFVRLTIAKGEDHDRPGQVLFEVADTGIGMSADQVGHIFERFTQADQSTTRKYGGSGLGLSIVKGLVQEMGGSISVDSQMGEGATFRVFLPLEVGENQHPAETEADETLIADACDKEYSVLIAEDNELNRITYEAILDGQGFRAEFAHNGAEAVVKAQANPYDIILMDIQMPVMGGVEAYKKIKDIPNNSDASPIPVIACTAHVFDEDVQNYLKLGFDGVMAKPIDPDKLITMMVEVVGNS